MMAKGRQRSAKWYFSNEEEVMRELGLKPTPGSGSQWTHKEDGENDYVLAQLKSTDKQSYSLKQLDLDKLEYNAMVAHKLPMFVIQFLNKDARYALLRIEDIPKIAEYIRTGEVQKPTESLFVDLNDDYEETKPKVKRKIKSSASAREQFYKEKEQAWEERKWRK